MMVIADTASSRMTNERYKWLEEVYIFYRDVSLSSARKKYQIQFLPIFLLSDECLLFEKQKFFKNDVRS